MEKAAGIVVLCKIKGTWFAFLSKRPFWNSEKNKPESWAGGYQVTAAGKMEEGDDGNFERCAQRELDEETKLVLHPSCFKEVNRKKTDEKEVVTFVAQATFSEIATAMKHAHLVPVVLNGAKEIQDMKAPRADGTLSVKETPFISEDGIRMFSDEKEAVVKALSSVC